MEVFSLIDAKVEAELVAKVMAGDERAEEELFLKYRRGVAIILNQATDNSPAAADLCQETFRITFQKIKQGKLREPGKLPAFIWKVTHNLVIDHFRRLRARDISNIEEAEEIADAKPDQLALLMEEEKKMLVRQVLGEMESERERQALYRFYIMEESKERICASLNLTAKQFNLVIFRARRHFRQLYEKMVSGK
ncbi:MAG TPA: sigma-70 family RNA polymerase sigma factor [Blastocatellia bacterium]